MLTVLRACSLVQVLVDTERDGHRVSFNEAFKQKGGREGSETGLGQGPGGGQHPRVASPQPQAEAEGWALSSNTTCRGAAMPRDTATAVGCKPSRLGVGDRKGGHTTHQAEPEGTQGKLPSSLPQ